MDTKYSFQRLMGAENPASIPVVLDAYLETLRDNRALDTDDLRALVFLADFLLDWLHKQGSIYRGFSFSYRTPLCLLIVKATIEDEAVVSFVSGRTLQNCAKILFRRCLEDSVEWQPDKYG